MIEFLKNKENYNPTIIVLLQPTSPFRTQRTTINAIKLFKKNPSKQVVGISYTKKKGINKKKLINGVIYLTSPGKLRRYKTFSYNDFLPLPIKSKKECIDIDTFEDLKLARSF